MPPSPAELSLQLRNGDAPELRRRRLVAGLGLAAAGSMGVITLYQLGIVKRLLEPPLPGLDAETVDGSAEAYRWLSTPDGALGLASYGATVALAAMGGRRRAEERPWIPLALLAKTSADAAFAAKLTVEQWTQHRAFCSWCLYAASASSAALPLAVPEGVAAARRLLSRRA